MYDISKYQIKHFLYIVKSSYFFKIFQYIKSDQSD